MVTHDMQLPSIATRVIVMSDGKVKDVLENSDEKRFQALQQLNNGIEDLSVFEMGNASVDSSTHSTPTEVRKPENYDQVHILESTEDRFQFLRKFMEAVYGVCFYNHEG